MRLVIGNKIYDFESGIPLLKTLYGNIYSKIPNDFKHDEIKKRWKLYKGIPLKLYEMSKSKDSEILLLASKTLKELRVKHETFKYWGENEISGIEIFKPIK